MQDIPQETHHETTRLTQSAQVVLWEIDLTEVGGERYFFCNEQNEKGEPVTWQGRQYQAYPIQGTGFELNGKGSAARPTLTVSNLHGMVTGMAEDLQSLVGGTVVRRKVYARKRMALFFRDVSCWPTPAPGPIAVMSAVITVRQSRMNMTSRRPISRRINAANA